MTFPITVRAFRPALASELRIYIPPGLERETRVPLPALSEGEARVVTVSLPLLTVGDFTIVCVSGGAQLDAVVEVRPDHVTVVSKEDHEQASHAVLREKLNNPLHRARNGGPLDGVRTAIVAEKASFTRGEPMSFHLSISNVGDHPLTLADARLGSGEMSVWLDGPTVNRQGLGKRYPVTDPFPDGLLHLGPGQRWDSKIVVDDPHDLAEIAGWPGGSFTYRFIYTSLAAPSSVGTRNGLANLWQGTLIAGDTPGHTVTIAGASAGPVPPPGPLDAATAPAAPPVETPSSDAGIDAGAGSRGHRWGCGINGASRPSFGRAALAVMVLGAAARRRVRRKTLSG